MITFLLGNGFDRALGLETGYGAFYEWYCNRPVKGLAPWVKEFRGEINKFITKDPTAEAYWSDAEVGLGQYTEKFTLETVDRYIDCYNDFRDNLVVYLKAQQELVETELVEKMKTHFGPQLVDCFQEIDPLEKLDVISTRNQITAREIPLNFVCFNYTNAIEQVFNALRADALGEWRGADGSIHKLKMGKLVRAHGTLERWPIIGVCDLHSIKNQELLKSPLFKATIQKSESITVSGELWRRTATELIKNNQIICVFGMSLGETDSDYWEMVTEWLAGSASRHLVVFWYDVKSDNVNMSIPAKFTEVNRVKEKLRDFSSWTASGYESIKKRIHVVLKPQKMFALPNGCKIQQPDWDSIPTVDGENLVFDCGGAPVV